MMDFTNIQNIVTPKGEVAMISRGDEILWQKSRLPLAYQEVEYIESTGTQWLDTGVIINTATDEVRLVFQNKESVVYKWFFGEHDNNARFGLGSGDGVNKRNVAYGNNTYKVTDAQLYNSQHNFSANANGIFLDGAKIANFASFASSSTLYLFNLNLSSGNYVAAAKVWSYKHTRNGVLIRDFIPCYRKSDGKVGMYDTVTETFFTNAGTGEFICDRPKYKTELEYLESTGTQWIDTGVILTNNHSVEIDYQITTVPKTNERKGLFGGLETNNGRYGSLVSPTTRKLEYGYGVGNTYYQTTIPDTNRHITKQEKNKVYVDGSLIYTFAEATFKMSSNAPLGTFNYTNYTPINAKYFGSKWWDGDTLVRDFIPVLDWDDRPCMYDRVTDELFYNQGTGEFLYA